MATTKIRATPRRVKKKPLHAKQVESAAIFSGDKFVVKRGKLNRRQGRPDASESLFKVVAEKLPFASLLDIKRDLSRFVDKDDRPAFKSQPQGVYVAHDSMGCPRYIGRGKIFDRLQARKKAQPLEIIYFSFYVVMDKKHEREIETLLIRSAGFLLEFNERKKRVGIAPGNVGDYEAGTHFYQRQRKKGAK